jgi:Zn-dependent protease with chaperone function
VAQSTETPQQPQPQPQPQQPQQPQQQGFAQSGRRTLVEVGILVLSLAVLFFVGRGCLGWAAERGAGQLPIELDEKIGQAGAEQFRAQYAASSKEPTQSQIDRVEGIFAELRDAMTPEETAVLLNPRVTVVVDEQVNAFALPGGEVFVLTGLLERVGDDDALIRGVLAHELGHAVRRHGVRLLARKAAFGVVLAMLIGEVDDLVVALAAGASQLDGLSHSRDMETEADTFGVDLLSRAGHDADGLARFMESLGTQPVPQLLSTHPDPLERAKVIRQQARD